MEIREASVKTGMVFSLGNDRWYAKKDRQGVLMWHHVEDSTRKVVPVPVTAILDDDYWQPYHPKENCPCGCREEECEACNHAENILNSRPDVAEHLRQYHCTCPKPD